MINIGELIKSCQLNTNGSFNQIDTPFFVNYTKIDFVSFVENKVYSKFVELPFRINDVKYKVAKKGCRPSNILRYSKSFPYQVKYLIKFNDGELRICDANLDKNTPLSSRNGEILASLDEDIHYVVIVLQGAGGGGSGSGRSISGCGGASGALLVSCICVDETWEVVCGIKGNRGEKQANGGIGGNTYAICNDSFLIAPGGNGGFYNSRGGDGLLPISSDSARCACFLSLRGKNGGNKDSGGQNFDAISTPNYGDLNENLIISFPFNSAGEQAAGVNGGSGAASAYGSGGKGEYLSNNGGNANGYGAGGGGGGQGLPALGGYGSDGLFSIYF